MCTSDILHRIAVDSHVRLLGSAESTVCTTSVTECYTQFNVLLLAIGCRLEGLLSHHSLHIEVGLISEIKINWQRCRLSVEIAAS